MTGEHVTFLEGGIAHGCSLAHYVSKLVAFHSLNLLVTRRFGAQHVPPVIDIFEITSIASELQHILMLESSDGERDESWPHEEAHEG